MTALRSSHRVSGRLRLPVRASVGAMCLALAAVILAAPSSALATDPPQFLLKWGTQGSGDGQFLYPYGIAVGLDGTVYVADTSNDRIQRFSATGAFLATWGASGTGDGQFDNPGGVAVAPDGDVYVGESGNDRVQWFGEADAGALGVGKTGPAGAWHGGPLTWVIDVTYTPGADGSPARDVAVADDACAPVAGPDRGADVDPDNDADASLEAGET